MSYLTIYYICVSTIASGLAMYLWIRQKKFTKIIHDQNIILHYKTQMIRMNNKIRKEMQERIDKLIRKNEELSDRLDQLDNTIEL